MERRAFVALLLSAVVAGVLGQGYDGDACKKKDGSAGVCRIISNCPEASEAVARRETPTICSYRGYSPVVCCASGRPTTPKPTPTPSPSPEQTPGPEPNARPATRMCTRYGESVFRYDKTFHIPPRTMKVDQCAIQGLPFITGGQEAIPNEFPHMALLGYGQDVQSPNWRCGGSLISNRFVMTAGHCIVTAEGEPKVARLGELNLKKTREANKHVDYLVEKSIPHPNYEDGIHYNDIGLLRLDRDVVFTASIRPACLQTTAIAESEAIASGWGYTKWENPQITDHLMKVELPIQNIEICQNAFKTLSTSFQLRNGITEESMICAGARDGKDTCKGDSGGPLQVKMRNPYCMYSVVGVTSFGKRNCGTRKSPAVYTRVSHFVSWIESIAWPNEN